MFSKNRLLALAAFLSLNTANASLTAQEYYCPCTPECYCPSECNRFYIGGFGGGIYANSTRLTQTGVAFFTEAEGGPLAVDARGNSGKESSAFGGVQIGYEWRESPIQIGCSDWSIAPAAELEAFFYRYTLKGDLINPTDRLPEHDFLNSLPVSAGIYLLNGVFSLNSFNLNKFSPYVGGGVGVAHLSIRHAKSTQIDPPEVGVNHFNSKRHDSTWAFAAQAKAGLRYNIFERFHVFAEYRFLFVDSSNYLFGSTNYPGHAPTTTWDVSASRIYHNAFTIGLQFDL